MRSLKEVIKKIPILNSLGLMIYRTFYKMPKFTTSHKYWEDRYKLGGNSGSGSYDRLAEFKAEVINEFIGEHRIRTVIEFGCGDGNQLRYLRMPAYIGFDVSDSALKKCKTVFVGDDTKSFRSMRAYGSEKADLTMSLDVIYHLIEDQTYDAYMATLFEASKKFVMIYSSNKDEYDPNTIHVKHRKFTDWVEQKQPAFKLIRSIPNKYPYNEDVENTSFADFFIFQRN